MITKQLKKYKPLSFVDVKINDSFWAKRIEVNREQTIPFQYEQCKATGRIDAFKLDWKPGMEPVPHIFWESDVAKWIEAASYSLATHPDAELDALLNEVIDLIAGAQQPDGYLNVYFTIVEPEKRWTDLRDAHELYCAGHLIEAGIAHFKATGKRTLFDVICKFADYIDTVFGLEEGKKRGYCGHQEIELALVKLYRVTGNENYLRLSQYFIDERGKQPHYFDLEKKIQPGFFDPFMNSHQDKNAYNQSHKPVREQDKVVGHAVRALYMYSAMADLAGELGDESLLQACERLWDNLHNKNMYITGGIGSTRANEGFTFDYDLPNETAYGETCAAVAVVFWNHRLLQLDCDGKYADALERALYNGVISGISLDGKKFFYENPLASLGNVHRRDWFGCACCPPNVARLLASLGEYVYSQNDHEIATHLYVEGSGKFNIQSQEVVLHQKTNYPWDGEITFNFEVGTPEKIGLKLRIPDWCQDALLEVNGENVEIADKLDKGYVTIEKEWTNDDTVKLILAMPAQRFYSNPKVRQNINHIAIQKGPVVYCLESTDNIEPLQKISICRDSGFVEEYIPELLDGVVKITGKGMVMDDNDWDNKLYKPVKPDASPFTFTAVPYYSWDNREPGEMRVWIPEMG
ncbi:glycoside hydrolase family 127 protein [Bacillus sp. FJAT-49732]|uniref:Glycoside hydrolase family 127 protein n=1 Tax=Lederbergia citrisecunda TaxID=2833583 RepID=A0A942TR31_9BACI|nr:beta-L-arabinofuranosidase domain-containing protein [Lederbergia citrisecunda]MBS4200557.1 glycoside hydrolase family 127 protein [Lederbergia citrisecunda]